jgi:hypothetical protein
MNSAWALRHFHQAGEGAGFHLFQYLAAVRLYGDFAKPSSSPTCLFNRPEATNAATSSEISRPFCFSAASKAVNRYKSIVDTLVQLFVPQTSGVIGFQRPDLFGMEHKRNKGEGS